jgi:ABC-type glucose/galactose transport system permease subunit
MLFLSASFALFYIRFSKKIPDKSASKVIKYFGVCAMIFAFLAVTPYHDTMITIADTLSLVSMFYSTVFIFKSKRHFSKFLSVLCMLSAYCCTFMYYTRSYIEVLPIMQKASLAISIIWILWLEYFTESEDFQHIKIAKIK